MTAVGYPSGRERGIALIVVLWMLVLLTVIIGTFAVLARTESLQARFLFDTTDARYAAEAGLHRAVVELRNPDLETRWVADGRPYAFEFGGAEVEVRITDETGLIDINAAAQARAVDQPVRVGGRRRADRGAADRGDPGLGRPG